MIRELALWTAAAVSCVAGAGAWAIHSGSANGIARLFTSGGKVAPPQPPAYPVRLELPPTRPIGLGTAGLASVESLPAGEDSAPEPDGAATAAPSTGSEFAKAFAPRPAMLDLNFDISTFRTLAPANSDRLIRATKSLSLGGNRLGAIELALGTGSMVAVDRRNLQALVAGKDDGLAAALEGLDGELVSFDALRDRGVRIRYDALADTVVIDSGA